MNSLLPNHISLDLLLRAAALAQLAVAILNLFLVRIMKWKPDLDRAPLLVREAFHIHVIFISITLSIFAVLPWRFGWRQRSERSGSLARSCNGCITARVTGAETRRAL